MKPAQFDYADPRSVEDAVALLQQHGADAKILAGGQSLVPLLNMRLARPAVIIDVGKLRDLDYIRDDGDALVIGALTTQRSVERSELVAREHPLLAATTRYIAHPQIRNRGTFGGSIAHADPAAECPALAVALDMQITVVGPGGARVIAAADFFVTYLTTSLEQDEILTDVRVPKLTPGTGWSIQEVARRHGDFAMAGAICTLTLERGRCAAARIALFGVGAVPVRAPEAEQTIIGQEPNAALFEEAGARASAEISEPLADIHGSSEFRRHLAGVMTQRALTEAFSRAEAR